MRAYCTTGTQSERGGYTTYSTQQGVYHRHTVRARGVHNIQQAAGCVPREQGLDVWKLLEALTRCIAKRFGSTIQAIQGPFSPVDLDLDAWTNQLLSTLDGQQVHE